jgi:hypothetical protein
MLNHPFSLLIIILLIIIMGLVVYKNIKCQKKKSTIFYMPIQTETFKNNFKKNNPIAKKIEHFQIPPRTEFDYRYGGKDMAFTIDKTNEASHEYYAYTVNYSNNKVDEYNLNKFKDKDSVDFIENSNSENSLANLNLTRPTSIRTCTITNKHYITSLSNNKIYIIDSTKKLTGEMLNSPNNQIDLGPSVSGTTYIDLYRIKDTSDKSDKPKLITNIGYTSNFNNNSISVIDLNSKKKLKDIPVENNPVYVCSSEENKLLFVANLSSNSVNYFSLEDPQNPALIGKLLVTNGTFNKPSCLEIMSDQSLIYVANSGSNEIFSFNINKSETDFSKKVTFNKKIIIPGVTNVYSIDFNNIDTIGSVVTNNGIFLLDSTKADNEIKNINDASRKIANIQDIQSTRIRSYTNSNQIKYQYVLITDNAGNLYRKIVSPTTPTVPEKYSNFKEYYNFYEL